MPVKMEPSAMKKTHYNMVPSSFPWFYRAVCAIISLDIFPACSHRCLKLLFADELTNLIVPRFLVRRHSY